MGLRQLTFLRFLAAFGVVIYHYGRAAPSLSWANSVWDVANSAVAFFFFLSGFILTSVYASRDRVPLGEFFVARAARILPLYLIALAGVALFEAWRGSLRLDHLALSFALLQSWIPGYSQVLNTPGWSLSVEVFFYILFPFALPFLLAVRSVGKLALLFAGLWLGNVLIHIILFQQVSADHSSVLADFTFYHPFTHAATFALGMVSARLFQLRRQAFTRFGLGLFFVGVAALLTVLLVRPTWLRYHHNGLLVPVFFAIIVGLGAASTSAIARSFASRWCETLGEASYGIYILQGPIALFFGTVVARTRIQLGPDTRFWLLASCIVGGSVLSFFFIEAPARALVKRWYAGRRALVTKTEAAS